MNKLMILAASSLFMLNVHADNNNLSCNYKDRFHISDQSHPAIYVMNGFSEQDLILEIIPPYDFIIRDSYFCRSGYAQVTVGYDSDHWCILNINDGPYINHPIINAKCNGMRYIDTTYDGIGSYSYSINLD